jgi:hypothetical protein
LQVAPANTRPKPAKELAYPTHRQKTMQQKMNVTTDRKEHRTDNRRLAKVAVQCSADTFLVNQSLVLRINICGENRHLLVAANRWWQA